MAPRLPYRKGILVLSKKSLEYDALIALETFYFAGKYSGP